LSFPDADILLLLGPIINISLSQALRSQNEEPIVCCYPQWYDSAACATLDTKSQLLKKKSTTLLQKGGETLMLSPRASPEFHP
jgi:hypothetical protein